MEKQIEHSYNEHGLEQEKVQEKEENKPLKIIKKIILIFIALFLLFLFLSYLLPSYNLFSIASSQFNSYKINQNIILYQ